MGYFEVVFFDVQLQAGGGGGGGWLVKVEVAEKEGKCSSSS